MADNNILKGMWCFNNTIDTTERTLTFNYSCNINGEIIECRDIQINQYGSVWYNYADNSNGANVYYAGKWYGEGNKTIVVAEGQEDKTDVLAFLQANANKVNWDVVYATPEDYLYSIASLQQGMSDMLVNQGGTKPQYASIEQYATSLIELRKEFTKLLNSYGVSASEGDKMSVEWANKFRDVINNIMTDSIVDFYDDTLTVVQGGVFSYRNKLETVEMTEVKELRGPVFMYCSSLNKQYKKPSLKKVVMPKLTHITDTDNNFVLIPTFGYQKNLTEVYAPLLYYISNGAFTGTGLTKVEFPELVWCGAGNYLKSSAASIGPFENCISLVEVNLPKCEHIRTNAFRGCTALKTVNLPVLYQLVDDYCFYGCTSLETINTGEVYDLRDYCFFQCTKLATFDFSKITSIGDYTFDQSGLTGEVNLPICTSVGGYAFNSCENITKFYAPELTTLSNRRVGTGATFENSYTFANCTSLVEVDMPKLSKVGSEGATSTFSGCTALKTVNLPLIPEVYAKMFENCTSLEEIDLPSALSCGQYAFQNCTSLKIVKLNAMTTGYNPNASPFYGCTSLETLELKNIISFRVGSISSLKEIYLDNVETLEQNTFNSCTSLIKVYMPKITSLPYQAFYKAGNLSETDFSNITTFGDYVFRDSKIINGLFPNLITMTHNSFKNCTALLNFEAPLLENMSTSNFSYCTSLKTAHLGKISKLWNYTFEKCTSLTDIYLGYDGLVTLDSIHAFSGTTNQQPVNVHVKSDYADSYATATNWSSLIAQGKIIIVGDYSD